LAAIEGHEDKNMDYNYKGFAVITSASRINQPPNEVWRPLYRINGKDQSQAWTPRDRNVVFSTEATAITEAGNRARWLIDNSPPTPNESDQAPEFAPVKSRLKS
jgi:hypothetical protein